MISSGISPDFCKYGFELLIRYGAVRCGIELTPPSSPPWSTALPFSSITAALWLLAVVELSLTEPSQSFVTKLGLSIFEARKPQYLLAFSAHDQKPI